MACTGAARHERPVRLGQRLRRAADHVGREHAHLRRHVLSSASHTAWMQGQSQTWHRMTDNAALGWPAGRHWIGSVGQGVPPCSRLLCSRKLQDYAAMTLMSYMQCSLCLALTASVLACTDSYTMHTLRSHRYISFPLHTHCTAACCCVTSRSTARSNALSPGGPTRGAAGHWAGLGAAGPKPISRSCDSCCSARSRPASAGLQACTADTCARQSERICNPPWSSGFDYACQQRIETSVLICAAPASCLARRQTLLARPAAGLLRCCRLRAATAASAG